MNTYYPWAVMNKLLERPRYGISHDDPSITAAEQCRYDACAEFAPNFITSGGGFKTVIPGGKYAVQGFKGSAAEMGDAWAALLGIGCPPADSNSMPVRASSSTRKTQHMTRKPGRSSAKYAFP